MKIFYALFVLAILISSAIPAAFAENDASSGSLQSANVVSAENTDDTSSDETDDDSTDESSDDISSGITTARRMAVTSSNQIRVQRVAAQPVAVGVSTRLAKCITFVRNNNLSTTPEATCRELIKEEKKCVDFLRENDVDNPVSICDRIFQQAAKIVTRSYVADSVAQNVTAYLLRKTDRVLASNSDAANLVKGLSDDNAQKFLHLTRAQQKNIVQMSNADALKEINKYKLTKINVQNLYKKRIITATQLKQAEQRFMAARNRYIAAQKRYQTNKELYQQVKIKYQACEDKDSEECQELQEEILEHAKDFLVDRVNMIIEYLNKIREKVESSDDLTEEEADEIIEDIDKAIDEFNDILNEISEAETKENIQDIAREINALWKRMSAYAIRYALRLLHVKVGEIIERSEHLEEKLDCVLENMEEQGIEVEAIETKVDLFSMRVDEARIKFRKAQELFDQVKELRGEDDKDIRTINNLMNEAKKLVREAHSALKNAHSLLMIIIRDIKAAGGNITSCVDANEVYKLVEESEPSTTEETLVNSFEDCVAAGYPVMESYPRQCATPSGEIFVEEIEEESNEGNESESSE